jgi:hypothetical protein
MGGALHPPIKLIQIRHIVSASITRGADACRHPERGLRAIGSELVAASLGIANQTMRTGDVQKLESRLMALDWRCSAVQC